MGAEVLESKAVMGMYFAALDQPNGIPWVGQVSNATPYESTQETETYGWLGQVPGMRELVGGRQAKGLADQSYTLRNQEYESTIEFLLKELRRDKTGQIQQRIQEHVDRAEAHWAELCTTLIENGESYTCYDGQYFFDTDHSEGDSGSQSNDLTPAATDADVPTAAEMASAIFAAIQAMMAFKDDQGKPMNATARNFLVMVPPNMMKAAHAAIHDSVIVDGSASRTNTLANNGKFTVDYDVNPYLTWTTKFAVFRTDGSVPALIRQQEEDVEVSALGEGSDLEFNERKHQYGLWASRAAGYGFWQYACLSTFTE